MICLKLKKFVQINIRGYKFQIILDSDFMVVTIIFQLMKRDNKSAN